MDDPDFQKGAVDITYLERAGARVLAATPRPGLERALAVAAALVADEHRDRPPPRLLTDGPPQSSTWITTSRQEALRGGRDSLGVTDSRDHHSNRGWRRRCGTAGGRFASSLFPELHGRSSPPARQLPRAPPQLPRARGRRDRTRESRTSRASLPALRERSLRRAASSSMSPTKASSAAKRAIVGDALRRIGKLKIEDPEIVEALDEWRYGSTISMEAKALTVGLHPYDRPNFVFPLADCHITDFKLMALWRELRSRLSLLPDRLTRLTLRLDREGRSHVIAESAGDPWLRRRPNCDRPAKRSHRLLVAAGGTGRRASSPDRRRAFRRRPSST